MRSVNNWPHKSVHR